MSIFSDIPYLESTGISTYTHIYIQTNIHNRSLMTVILHDGYCKNVPYVK